MSTNILAVLQLTASWYGAECQGNLMANGEPFDMFASTCAIWGLPFGTKLWINPYWDDVKTAVTVTDRGPAKRLLSTRQIDLAEVVFTKFASTSEGITPVTITINHSDNDPQVIKGLRELARLSKIPVRTRSTPFPRRQTSRRQVGSKPSITIHVPQKKGN